MYNQNKPLIRILKGNTVVDNLEFTLNEHISEQFFLGKGQILVLIYLHHNIIIHSSVIKDQWEHILTERLNIRFGQKLFN